MRLNRKFTMTFARTLKKKMFLGGVTYAERAKVMPMGKGNDNLHYDIAYIENGVKRFDEVKGSSSLSDISIKKT
ncbi:MAG: hypothetical protein LBF68_06235 [Christensenellaceae bacterium]|nr:hypothetical protein [Christensenellaceae bacterium]